MPQCEPQKSEPVRNAVSREEASREAEISIRRLVHLFCHAARVLTEKFGEETAEKLLAEIIDSFGTDCGRQARETVEAMGLENDLVNHALARDLPLGVFDSRLTVSGDPDKKINEVRYCPYAAEFQRIGCEKWGRMYCEIDHAKYRAYNSAYVCSHDKNILDGDDCCVIRVEKEKTDEKEG